MSIGKPSANFIRHLVKIHEMFQEDNRLSPFHISVYYALFFEWNENRFRNPFPIFRADIMNASKIGSVNTYTKCLKELDQFGYIQYSPSFNPNKGSRVNLYTFDNGQSKGRDTSLNKADDNASIQVVIPFNKHIKQNKDIKQYKDNSIFDMQVEHDSKSKNQKLNKSSSGTEIPPTLNEAILFFKEKESSVLEAERFFNHYESNGWLIGGKSKMKNWEAAARNWILNTKKYNLASPKEAKNYLNTEENKDYTIPL